MDFVMSCVRVGFGCAIGVFAFCLTLFMILLIMAALGKLNKKMKGK